MLGIRLLNEEIYKIPYLDILKYLVCLWNYVNYSILIISLTNEWFIG